MKGLNNKYHIPIAWSVTWRWLIQCFLPTLILFVFYKSFSTNIESSLKYFGYIAIYLFNHLWFCIWIGHCLLHTDFKAFHLCIKDEPLPEHKRGTPYTEFAKIFLKCYSPTFLIKVWLISLLVSIGVVLLGFLVAFIMTIIE